LSREQLLAVKQYEQTNNNNTRLTPSSGTTRVSRYQKGKTNLDLLEQETMSGSGISWAIF